VKNKQKSKEALRDSYLSSQTQRTLEERRSEYFERAVGTPTEKMVSLGRFMNRQNCAKLVAQNAMMTMTKGVLGDIVEAGVYFGGGLMNWALLSAALEPYNYQCKVLGFDTFEGSVGISDVDRKNPNLKRRDGDYFAPCYDDLLESISIFDADRPLGHIKKVQLIKGDIRKTAPKYAAENIHLQVRILHIGMNIYEPTREALKVFLPRMPKGSIVAIDGLNHATGGCQEALAEVTGKARLPMRVFDYYPNFTYYVVE
jgi:hypothetical protein